MLHAPWMVTKSIPICVVKIMFDHVIFVIRFKKNTLISIIYKKIFKKFHYCYRVIAMTIYHNDHCCINVIGKNLSLSVTAVILFIN